MSDIDNPESDTEIVHDVVQDIEIDTEPDIQINNTPKNKDVVFVNNIFRDLEEELENLQRSNSGDSTDDDVYLKLKTKLAKSKSDLSNEMNYLTQNIENEIDPSNLKRSNQFDRSDRSERLAKSSYAHLEQNREIMDRLKDEIEYLNQKNSETVRAYELRMKDMEKYYENMQRDNLLNDDESEQSRGINWDSGNIKTVYDWISECDKQGYIYETVLENVRNQYRNITLLILIIGGLSTLISSINLALDKDKNPQLELGISIIIPILTFFTFVLTGYLRINKIQETIETYTAYIEKISSFLSNLVSEISLKIELRKDGNEFILQNREIYHSIYKDSPFIDQKEFKKGMNSYRDYLNNIDLEEGNMLQRKRNNIKEFTKDKMCNLKEENNLKENLLDPSELSNENIDNNDNNDNHNENYNPPVPNLRDQSNREDQ